MSIFKMFALSAIAIVCWSQNPVMAADAKKETQPKPYPLDICLVTGEKLGSMGEPVKIVHEGQEIKFCCKGCIKKFQKDPAPYLKKLSESANKKK